MSITKSEAIVMLAMSTGNTDGNFTPEEVNAVLTKNPSFREEFAEAQSTDWTTKVRLEELTIDSALDALNELPIEDKTEAMSICWGIILSDGVTTDNETHMIDEWINKLDLNSGDIKGKRESVN